MTSLHKPTVLDIVFSLIIGSVVSIAVALCSGLVSNLFASQHYIDQHSINHMVLGLVLGYAISFVIFSMFLLALSKVTALWFPAATLAAGLGTCLWRSLGSAVSSLDCGNSCVDTQLPLTAERRASAYIYIVTAVLFVITCVINTRFMKAAAQNNVAKPTRSV